MLTIVGQGAESVARTGPAQRLGELTAALQHEARLIEDLRQALLRQRDGVATDDAATIETSVQAIGRTLLTLEEARRRRTTLTDYISGERTTELGELEHYVGPLPESLLTARAMVRRVAVSVQQDVVINQTILRRALDAGDAFLQQLFSSAAEPSPAYLPGPRPSEAPQGMLLNRTA